MLMNLEMSKIISFLVLILLSAGVFTKNIAEKVPKGFNILSAANTTNNSIIYIISQNEVDWNTSRLICDSIGPFRFASPENVEKCSQLYFQLASNDIREVWVSGNDFASNGNFTWAGLNEKPFGDFQDWRDPESPSNPAYHCVSVTAVTEECSGCTGKWGWEEENCSGLKRAVCEPIMD